MAKDSLKIKLRHIHKHINVLKWHLILSLAKKKKEKKSELNDVIRNSSSWPNMSTGDPVVCVFVCFLLLKA